MAVSSTPTRPRPGGPPARARAGRAARVSGRSATASRSTPTSGSRRTTTRSTSGPASRTSTPTAASPPSTRRTCAAGSAGGASTPSARPGIDGGRTAVLEPHELEDEYFMLRVRVDGGQLNLAQLRAIADISTRVRAGTPPTSPTGRTSSCTGSGSRTCRRSGAGSRRSACRPPRRAATARASCSAARSPASPRDEVIDPTPAIDEIVERYVGDPQFSNLPRKFKTSISWLADTPYEVERHRASSASTTRSTAPASTSGSAAASPPTRCSPSGSASGCRCDEVPDVWAGVVGIFRDYGYRRLRNRARLKFLVADWGVEKFREVLEKEYLGRTLLDGPAPELPDEADRPHRRAPAARRAQLRRRRPGGRAGLRRAARPARRRRRGARQRPGAAHAVPEAAGARRRRRSGRSRWSRALRGDRPGGPAVGLAARHDGLHRHRVLQARHRRDQGPRRGAGGPAGGAAARLRRRHLHPHQRLPERLRPHPGRRHRPQGPAGGRPGRPSRSRASRCTSAAASAWRRGRPPASAASCAA